MGEGSGQDGTGERLFELALKVTELAKRKVVKGEKHVLEVERSV